MARLPTLRSALSPLNQSTAAPLASADDEIAQSYHTRAWRKLARECKKRDGYKCTMDDCETPGRGYGGRLIADHVTAKRDGGADELSNLRTVCNPCHERITRRGLR